MRPFPPKDGLEPIQRHVRIELGELRDLLVPVELGLPLGAAERRKNARDRLPLCDGEAGFGEPRCAPNQHHEKDEARDGDQPEANRPASVETHDLGGDGRAVGQSHGLGEACIQDCSARSLSPAFCLKRCPRRNAVLRKSGVGLRTMRPPLDSPGLRPGEQAQICRRHLRRLLEKTEFHATTVHSAEPKPALREVARRRRMRPLSACCVKP